ncbi:MAG: M28 family peptidase [Candidatus Acidiferrales bacterium]
MLRFRKAVWLGAPALAALMTIACSHDGGSSKAEQNAPGSPTVAQGSSAAADSGKPSLLVHRAGPAAPPASETGGFDGNKAFDHVAQLVAIGPHPPASDGIRRAQDYIRTQLKSYGCEIDEDDFHAQTPIGDVAMKNIVAKAPGERPGIILLLTHYDTLSSVKDFVGAEDSGSSTGLMLEMARLLCAKKQANAVWIAFLDGEEAFVDWNQNDDHTYGSRELSARMAVSGDLKRVKAVILSDMVGQTDLEIQRETNSTKWLTDLIWKKAASLGYKDIFVSREGEVSDDHQPFLARGVPAVDIIDLEGYTRPGYWHTTQDTLDKVSARSLAIVGYVILESVGELQKKFR